MQKISKEYTLLKPIFMLFLQILILINLFHMLSSQSFVISGSEMYLLFSVIAIAILGLMTLKSLARLNK